MLVILLNVEGGSLGRVSQNTNDTVDIGPMQVNQIWLPQSPRTGTRRSPIRYRALRDDFCANVEAGAWILRQGLDEAHGDFWQGVGYYHSHDPEYKRDLSAGRADAGAAPAVAAPDGAARPVPAAESRGTPTRRARRPPHAGARN